MSFATYTVSTHHDPNGVLITAGNLPRETIHALRALGREHASPDPKLHNSRREPLPTKCFRNKEMYEIYREGYDSVRVPVDGPEWIINSDGSKRWNWKWAGGYGWSFVFEVPDALEMAGVVDGY